ncbi:MAG: aminotransferase class V-fold PLP-dependent enzyme [Acidimicrobiia bacterium]
MPEPSNSVWGPDWPEVRRRWALDPEVAHLNHGSFGAVPKAVVAEQDRLRREMEANPTGFFWRELNPLLNGARQAAAQFLGAAPEGLPFVRNATTGVNATLRSIPLEAGDEVLVTDHAYGAVKLSAERVCEERGAILRTQPVRLSASPRDLAEAVLAGVSPATRVAIVDQVASPTGLVFPVSEIVAALRRQGIISLVDGAHAPGTLDVRVEELAADFWVGNFHKWVCAPRGAGALWATEELRSLLRPVVTTYGIEEGFPASFAWAGTDDYTAWLTVPAALDFLGSLGWDRLRHHNRTLADLGRSIVAAALGTAGDLPDFPHAAMSLVALPEGIADLPEEARALSEGIAEELRVEVAVSAWNGRGYLRLSAFAYNCPADYQRLAVGLPGLL